MALVHICVLNELFINLLHMDFLYLRTVVDILILMRRLARMSMMTRIPA